MPNFLISNNEALAIQEALAELTRHKAEALTLYQPLLMQEAFHASRAKERLVYGSNRAGKAQPVDEPVLTPFGWVSIGSLVPGDLVIGGDGKPARVLAVYPQGQKPIFTVTFSDGASTRCCEDHLWKVAIRNDRFGKGETQWRTFSLKEIRSRCGDVPAPWSKPLIPSPALWLPRRALPIHPYLMGVLIGDGCMAQDVVTVTTADQEIAAAIQEMLPAGIRMKVKSKYDYHLSADRGANDLIRIFRWYGMMGKRAHEKSIPHDYLFNSQQNRLDLLRGLLDTDGCVSKVASEFCTTSPQLAEQVAFLVRSLGGTCHTTWRVTRYEYKRQHLPGRRSARCYIRFPEGVNPFRLARKASAVQTSARPFVGRLMERIEPAGQDECVCIAVDTPDQTYITKDCIVTHNTLAPAVEVARACCGLDPHDKYPKRDGRCIVLGFDLTHVGRVMWPKLYRPGAFKMIRDRLTGQWRSWCPWDPDDASRKKEVRRSASLIPHRLIESIAWEDKKKDQPSTVKLTTGWELWFYSSRADPSRGFDCDLIWIDEEIENAIWYVEMLMRLIDRGGRMVWGATPQTATEKLYDLHLRAEKSRDTGEGSVEEFFLTMAGNPYLTDEDKRDAVRQLEGDEEAYRVRIEGGWAIEGQRIFPEFSRNVHVVKTVPIPHDWTRYLAVDPGRTNCGVLMVAVSPDESFIDVYDEILIHGADAEKFGEAMVPKTAEQIFQAFLIDSRMGRTHEVGSGVQTQEHYSRALAKRKVASITTQSNFLWGSTDEKGRIESLRSWLRIRQDGTTKIRVHDRCELFIKQMERWYYIRRKDGVTETTVKKGDDLIDCACYLAAFGCAYVKPRKPKGRAEGAYADYQDKKKRRKMKAGVDGGVQLGPPQEMNQLSTF